MRRIVLLAALLVALGVLSGGEGFTDAQVGSSGNKIKVTERPNLLVGRGGHDEIFGHGQWDTIFGGGTYTSASLAAAANVNLPTGSTYTITKQYVSLQTAVSPATLANSSTDTEMMRVTITVNWPSNNSITASGIVTRNL